MSASPNAPSHGQTSPDQLLRAGLARLGLQYSDDQAKKLLALDREIELWNRRTNLVRAAGTELVVRHLLDSLAALPVFDELGPPDTVADLGSGAGFPGLPLAIMRPATSFHLIERSSRRADFLFSAAALLGLSNVRVFPIEVERHSGSYRLATFRAFLPLARAARLAGDLLAPGARIVAYAGKRSGIEQELADLPAPFVLRRIAPLEVPFLEAERHVVVLERAGDQ